MNFADRAELCPPDGLTPEAAIALQERWRSRVVARDRFEVLDRIAGIDVGYSKDGSRMQAAVVVLDRASLEPLDTAIAAGVPNFPYTPGLLSFREVPLVVAALEKLTVLPEAIVCDGQGLAHPRRFGLACHLGVLLDVPAIGVAKSHYVGEYETVGRDRGSWEPLQDRAIGGNSEDETIGAVVRTQADVKPVYVSIGHRFGLETAIELAIELAPRYRLPETTRQADRLSRQFYTKPGK
ncbi:MAG: deoxyribonuclease V [Geitlerinemataceae cyanobacterium]